MSAGSRDEGLRVSSATSDHYWDSELRRFKGEGPAPARPRVGRGACFLGALADARMARRSPRAACRDEPRSLRTKEGNE